MAVPVTVPTNSVHFASVAAFVDVNNAVSVVLGEDFHSTASRIKDDPTIDNGDGDIGSSIRRNELTIDLSQEDVILKRTRGIKQRTRSI